MMGLGFVLFLLGALFVDSNMTSAIIVCSLGFILMFIGYKRGEADED